MLYIVITSASILTSTILIYLIAIVYYGANLTGDLLSKRSPRGGFAIAVLCEYAGVLMALIGYLSARLELTTVGVLLAALSIIMHRDRGSPIDHRIGSVVLPLGIASSLLAIGFAASAAFH